MAEFNITTKSVANPKTLVASICLLLAVALVLSTGIGALLPQSAQAVTNKSAHKAYKKVAKKLCLKNNGWTSYYFKDINGDGLDEFVIFAGNEAAGYQLYTCKTGKAKRLMSISHGLYSKYYKGSKVLYTDCSHMGYTTHAYYKWSNKKIGSPVAVKRIDTNPVAQGAKAVVTYEVKGKTVSKKKFNSYVKKLKKGKVNNLAKTKLKDYEPVKDASSAKTYFRKWAKVNGVNSVDYLSYECYEPNRGYLLRGVNSFETHDATAYRYYVNEAGHVVKDL